jgi:hypothetical protein
MGERTGYTPGTFSWTDLTSTDQEGAKAFYSGLFGWVAEDMPVGDDIYYSIQRKDGKDVAAISPQQRAHPQPGTPTFRWRTPTPSPIARRSSAPRSLRRHST